MTRKLILVAVLVLSLGALSAGIALATIGGEKPLAGSVLDKATAAALDGTAAALQNDRSCGRVDLATPAFTHPTSITHPLFPKGSLSQVIQLGAEGAGKLRFEVTQLPKTRVVRWKGQNVKTRVTHFMAYSNGRILEVAVDFYAQADDGSVWYFGENVDNYKKGVIADHKGTWLAGKDGPPGMIMPARPRVCDVYRPENIPGVVFEEVTVKSVGRTVMGPRGPVPAAVFVRERLMDKTLEDKIYAPGYGEFQAKVTSLNELYSVALAVPIDALSGTMPRQISALSNGATVVFEAAPSESWNRISSRLRTMTAAWDTYRTRKVPRLLRTQMSRALAGLHAAVAAREPDSVRQAAIRVGHASLDLQLRYRPTAAVDQARLRIWRRQLVIDRAAHDSAAVAGDLATLKAIGDRIPSSSGSK